MAYEALAENAESGFAPIPFQNSQEKQTLATNFWSSKLIELERFMEENKSVSTDKIDFLLNADKYRRQAEQLELRESKKGSKYAANGKINPI